MFADVNSPYHLPLYWPSVPFSRYAMVEYATKAGLDVISRGLVEKGWT